MADESSRDVEPGLVTIDDKHGGFSKGIGQFDERVQQRLQVVPIGRIVEKDGLKVNGLTDVNTTLGEACSKAVLKKLSPRHS